DGQRQSVTGVQIARRLQNVPRLPQAMRDQVLHRRFARAGGDADDGPAPLRDHPRRQLLKRAERVFDEEQFAGVIAELSRKRQPVMNYHRGAGAFFKDLTNEPVAVNPFPRNRDEQLARLDCARINRESGGFGLRQFVIQHVARAPQPRDLALLHLRLRKLVGRYNRSFRLFSILSALVLYWPPFFLTPPFLNLFLSASASRATSRSSKSILPVGRI